MKHTKIKTNFIYPDILPTQFIFGSGEVVGTILREDGDWRNFLPPEEDQNIRGIESSACYIEAQQHTIATIEEEQYNEKDNNYSARFNALLSGGTQNGGDPLKGADSIRNNGLVKDSSMPFGNDIQSWNDFHSWKGVAEQVLREEGLNYLSRKNLSYDLIFEMFEPVESKYKKLREVLKYCPPPVSVVGWYEENGLYVKPVGARDNHLVELIYIDENNYPYIRDTYFPYIKKLDKFYDFSFGMRWTVDKKKVITEEDTKNILQVLWELIKKGLANFFPSFLDNYTVEPPIVIPTPVTPVITVQQRLKEAVLSSIGKDLSSIALNEVACVEAVSQVLKKVDPNFPLLLSTIALNDHLKLESRTTKKYKPTLDIKEWQIILNVTGTGNGSLKNGHGGFIGENGKIYSNNSFTGKFEQNYTLDTWKKKFRIEGGMPTLVFDLT